MIKLLRGKEEREYSIEHAQNLLNHPVNAKVEKDVKFSLPKDSDYEMKDGKLEKKPKVEKKSK